MKILLNTINLTVLAFDTEFAERIRENFPSEFSVPENLRVITLNALFPC
jgi:hypothetical protein